MEITKSQIARLVLGYLKSENCINAFNEFLIKSQYLKSHAVFIKNGKYFATRVGGNTLEEIIAEYSEMALIIEGRLEQTNYYDKDLRMKLPEQLLYILDHVSRSTSPILPDNLNATPIESLPGNSMNISHNSNDKSTANSRDKTLADTEKCTPMECQNTLNISPGLLQKGEKRTSLADLDNKITSIKQKPEKDPAFDKILEEIIGDQTDESALVSTTKSHLDKNQSSDIIEISDNELNKKDSYELSNKKTCDTSHSDVKKFNNHTSDLYISQPSTVSPQQNQFFLTNTSGLLMVPSLMNAPNYIFLNNGPTATTPLNNIVTETELMKMPTVIIEESTSTQPPLLTVPQPQMAIQQSQILNNQHSIMVNSSQLIMTSKPPTMTSQKPTMSKITSNTANTNSKGVKKIKTIAPRTEKITLSTADGNFYQVFDENPNHMVLSTKVLETVTSCNNSELNKSLKPAISNAVMFSPPKKDKSPSSPMKISKDLQLSPKSEKRKKTAKSLFKDSKKIQKENVWDADLRKLLETSPISGEQKDISDQQDISDAQFDVSDDKLDVSCDDEELKRGALMIESAFKTPVKMQHMEEKQEVAQTKEISIDEKKTVTAHSPKEKSEPSEIIGEQCSVKPEDLGNEEEKVITEETEVYLRNCNGPPRIKKKCNPTKTNLVVLKVVEENSFTEEKTLDELPLSIESESRMNRDIILQTPVKGNFPKTPGKFEVTPFTKAIEEQLLGMDLLSLPTPNITTPSFPITPNINLNTPEPHSNRPTDYSTSSSYYQPSDPEQNKSLEMMMEEYRREDRMKQNPIKIEENAITNSKKEVEVSQVPVMSEIRKSFNKSVIGKKNLNLMKEKIYPCSEDAENSDSSSTNSSSSESSNTSDSDSDAYHTPKKATSGPRESYSFRKRITPTSIVTDESNKKLKSPLTRKANKETDSIQHENTEIKENTLKKDSTNTLSTTRRRNPPRTKSGKFCKIKNEPKMSRKGNEQLLVEKCDYENEITDDDFALHLSTDEDSTNKINNDVGTHKNKEENSSISSQQVHQPPSEEAKHMIQALFDRGIHLLPKVSPKKTSDSSLEVGKKIDSESEINLNALENLEVSSEDNLSSGNNMDAPDTFQIHNRANIEFGIKEDYSSNIFVSSSKKRKKQGGDFNLSGKKLSVELFVGTVDTTKEVIIEILPVDTIINIVPKKNTVRNRKNSKLESKPTNSKVSTSTSKKELESKTNSENEHKSTEKIEKKHESFSKEVKNNDGCEIKKTENVVTVSPKKSHSKKLRSCSTDDRNKEKDKNNRNTSNKVAEIILERSKSVEETVIKRLQNDKDESPPIESAEDDLMNFAVIGNSREPGKYVSLKKGEKRKLSSEGESQQHEKKPKSGNEEKKELLQRVNVDLFLNRLHGSEEPS